LCSLFFSFFKCFFLFFGLFFTAILFIFWHFLSHCHFSCLSHTMCCQFCCRIRALFRLSPFACPCGQVIGTGTNSNLRQFVTCTNVANWSPVIRTGTNSNLQVIGHRHRLPLWPARPSRRLGRMDRPSRPHQRRAAPGSVELGQ